MHQVSAHGMWTAWTVDGVTQVWWNGKEGRTSEGYTVKIHEYWGEMDV